MRTGVALPAGHRLRRAWPGPSHLVLEVLDPRGRVVTGSWQPPSPVELYPPGEDPALPGLAAVASSGRLVSHRRGRRAVVRTVDGYVKVVRPSRAAELARRHRDVTAALDPERVRTATVRAVDAASGVVAFTPLSGCPLLGRERPDLDAGPVASALAAFAAAPCPPGVGTHTAADERGVLARWLADVRRFALLDEPAMAHLTAAAEAAAAAVTRLADRPAVLSHRDLHDGQVLVDGVRPPGIIDLDTAAVADPALDLGNLLAHVDLAVHEGRVGPATAAAVARALACTAPDDATAVGAYRLAAAVRLVAVHAFRPSTGPAALRLLASLPRSFCAGEPERSALVRRAPSPPSRDGR